MGKTLTPLEKYDILIEIKKRIEIALYYEKDDEIANKKLLLIYPEKNDIHINSYYQILIQINKDLKQYEI